MQQSYEHQTSSASAIQPGTEAAAIMQQQQAVNAYASAVQLQHQQAQQAAATGVVQSTAKTSDLHSQNFMSNTSQIAAYQTPSMVQPQSQTYYATTASSNTGQQYQTNYDNMVQSELQNSVYTAQTAAVTGQNLNTPLTKLASTYHQPVQATTSTAIQVAQAQAVQATAEAQAHATACQQAQAKSAQYQAQANQMALTSQVIQNTYNYQNPQSAIVSTNVQSTTDQSSLRPVSLQNQGLNTRVQLNQQSSSVQQRNVQTLKIIEQHMSQLDSLKAEASQHVKQLILQLEATYEQLKQTSMNNDNHQTYYMQNQAFFSQKNTSYPIYIKFFLGGVLYSTKGNPIDVAVIRDKNSGKSRGFAFVTFIVYPTNQEVHEAQMIIQQKIRYGQELDQDEEVRKLLTECSEAKELNSKMLSPSKPHTVQTRQVEIRKSDGEKPQDSFVTKKQQQKDKEKKKDKERDSRDRDRDRRRKDREVRSRRRGRRARNDSYSSDDRRQRKRHSDSRSRSCSRSSRSYSENDLVSKHNGHPFKNQYFEQVRYDKEAAKLRSPAYNHIRDKVFIGGLDYQLTEEEFRDHFAQYGSIKECQIIKDPATKQSRGFGFVRYHDDKVSVDLITIMQVVYLKGRRVDMRTADLKGNNEKPSRISPQTEREAQPRQKSPVRGYSHPRPATINSPMNQSMGTPLEVQNSIMFPPTTQVQQQAEWPPVMPLQQPAQESVLKQLGLEQPNSKETEH